MMNWVFFSVKKAISVFLYPLGLSLVLWALGIIVWVRNRGSRTGFSLVLCGGLCLAIPSCPLVSDRLLRSLEVKAGPYSDPAELQKKGVKFIVVLGGDLRAGDLTPADRVGYTSLVRCMEGIRLWKRMPGSKLVLSGGSISSKKMSTADGMSIFAQDLGVPKDAIVLEGESWDTADEAEQLKPVLGRNAFALVTSAPHMWRALIIFRRAGLSPVPAPADFDTKVISFEYDKLYPSAASLAASQQAVHEYLGVCALLIKDLLTGKSPADFVPRSSQ
ncbi:MAG TPA: ElyC/SanA/YdcF family protein [Desulfomonilaceae bacterium]|nr:ElyC/SanA/YdcF family protein [Desulfomonilaceae bacterium]